jgi:NitT/TauT family transport system ATP-binding protein
MADRDPAYLELDHVSKTFTIERRGGKEELHALDDISFTVEEGTFLSICGPSGCGKSTLLRIIDGLQTTERGEARVRGERITRPGPDRGMVFQHHNLMPWRTVVRNVEFGLETQGISKAERRERALGWLERVGLTEFAGYYPGQLSGGMQQRVGLARALAIDPDMLLMDEPFGALDAQTRIVLQEELERIWAGASKTVIFITHDIDEALYLSDRVLVMSRRPGRVIADVHVDAGRPRGDEWRASAEFAELKGHLWELLRDGARAAAHVDAPPA